MPPRARVRASLTSLLSFDRDFSIIVAYSSVNPGVLRRATRNVRENSCSGLMPVNRAALIGGPSRYEGMCFGGRGVEGRIVSDAGYRGGGCYSSK